MTIAVEIIKDSVGPNRRRLTTFLLTYPRFIHAELMTHRVFSRNASSSRAIPVKKSMDLIRADPVRPMSWTSNKPGMQGGEPLAHDRALAAIAAWGRAMAAALTAAEELRELEVHKQYGNRLLEPYAHIAVVLTSTYFANWYTLRCHETAMPEIKVLADAMFRLHKQSEPQRLLEGDWHLPFVDSTYGSQDNIERSVACCARTSYLNHDKTTSTPDEDHGLHERLLGSDPLHASPAEHQARATKERDIRSGNFRGWIQYRKQLTSECATTFTAPDGETWTDE